jgi:acetyl-CoA C-acetyltransferase
MTDCFIVAAARTAGGRRNGGLSGVHPTDLAARSLDGAVAQAAIDPAAVEDVIMGCVGQIGQQSWNVARQSVLVSSLPQSVPATTVDRQCGSSQQAVHFAAQAVLSGTMDVVIAAGVESMSRVPMASPYTVAHAAGLGGPFSEELKRRYPGDDFSQFWSAEKIAQDYGITRDAMDEFSLGSHHKASAALTSGDFKGQVVPVEITTAQGHVQWHTIDEGVRPDTSLDALRELKTLTKGGRLTAGNSSQICDGSSALVLASERAVRDHGLTPLARIASLTVTAGDPVNLLVEPLFATERALKRAGLTLDDIDLYEVNEAFASIPLAWLKHLDADPAKLNVQGGAIALGHALGASGGRIMTTLVHALRSRGARYGLQTMCEGGGLANVTIIEAF